MGMYDSVTATCPECRTKMEFQSKAGRCHLDKYSARSVPIVIALDLEGYAQTCPGCGARVKLEILYPPPPVVSMYTTLCEGDEA